MPSIGSTPTDAVVMLLRLAHEDLNQRHVVRQRARRFQHNTARREIGLDFKPILAFRKVLRYVEYHAGRLIVEDVGDVGSNFQLAHQTEPAQRHAVCLYALDFRAGSFRRMTAD